MSIQVPDACTLPTAEQPLRLAEFDHLFATAVRSVELIDPVHARLELAGSEGLAATVTDLTNRETECCSFFAFTVTPTAPADPDAEAVTLHIGVPAQYADVLESLVGRATSMAAGA